MKLGPLGGPGGGPEQGTRRNRAQARQQPQAETAGRRVVPLRPLAGDLVQRAERQAAARQTIVEGARPQGDHAQGAPPGAALEHPDARPQSL